MHWLIELKGSERSLQFLKEQLHSPDFLIVEDERGTYIKLPNIAVGPYPGSLRAPVKKIVDVLNGAALLHWPHFQGVSANLVHQVAEDGSRQSYGFLTAQAPLTTLYAFLPGDPTLINWIQLAARVPAVEKALTLYSVLEHDWRGLYMILEVLKDDLGGWSALVSAGLLSNAQMRSFKHTADSYPAVGHSARHATTSIKAPAKPMTLQDATALIDEVLHKWLALKTDNASRDGRA